MMPMCRIQISGGRKRENKSLRQISSTELEFLVLSFRTVRNCLRHYDFRVAERAEFDVCFSEIIQLLRKINRKEIIRGNLKSLSNVESGTASCEGAGFSKVG